MPRHLSDRLDKLERQKTDLKWLGHVNVIDMLEQLQIENISQANATEVRFSCPFEGHSHGDENPSAFMNDGSHNPKSTTAWKCHGCKRKGNAITFVAELEGVSRQKAIRWLKDHYAAGYIAPKFGKISAEFEERRKKLEQIRQEEHRVACVELDFDQVYKPMLINWPDYVSGYEDCPDVMYMFTRSFDARTLLYWKIGYHQYTERITIPIFDENRRFVGIKGRAWNVDNKPKYRVLGDKEGRRPFFGFPTYDKSLVVFGLAEWGPQSRFVLVEGELDVLALWMLGIPAISVGGSSLSERQAQLIREHCDEVVLFLDDDAAGIAGLWGRDKDDGHHQPGIIDVLEPFIRVRVVGKHKHDPNDFLIQGKTATLRRLIDQAKSSYRLSPPTV